MTSTLENRYCYELFHRQPKPPQNCPALHLIRTGSSRKAEIQVDSLTRTFMVSCTALSSADGDLKEIIHLGTDITDRKRAEDRLALSEARYRSVVEAHLDLICRWRPDTSLTFTNQRFRDFVGMAHDQAAGRRQWIEFIPLSQRTSSQRRQQQQIQDPQTICYENSMTNSSGEVRWFHWIDTPIFDDNGDLVEFQSIGRDITASRQHQVRLKRSAAHLQTAFEQASIGMALSLPDGRLNRVNQAFAEMLGYPIDTLIQKRWSEITHPDDIAGPHQTVETLLAGQSTPDRVQKRYISADGKVVWANVSTVQLRNDDGQPNHFISHIFDITQKKEIEGRLQHHQELLQAILDNIPLMVVFMDKTGRIHWVNKAWEQTTGYSLNEAMDMRIWKKLYPDPLYLKGVLGVVRKAHGQWKNFKTHIRDGKTIDTIWANMILSDGTNVGISGDVTELKRAQMVQKELQAQLYQAQKMESIGRLAGGVAHDFNNLLSIILGYTELLENDLSQDHPVRQGLQEIHAAAIRAKNLSRQLLAFARKQVLEVKPVDLNRVVTGFEKMLRRLIGDNIEFYLHLSSDPLPVKGDMVQLEQVLLNLSVNARDAMPQGGSLCIETSSVNLDDTFKESHPDIKSGLHACLAVSDTGIGIAKDIRNAIFDPFFSTKPKYKGTGLGLSTVYGIIKQHQGNIWVASEPGHGSTFKVHLPIDNEVALRPGALPKAERTLEIRSWRHFASREIAIMVVEADPSVRLLTVKILSKAGFTVLAASDSRDAMDRSSDRSSPIHMAVVDLVMPGMTGPELIEQITRFNPGIKSLYMSGYTENAISHQGMSNHGIHFISKPFTARELLFKVVSILQA